MRPLQGRFLIEEKTEGSRVQPDFLSFLYFIWKGSRRLPHRYSMRQGRGGGRRPSDLDLRVLDSAGGACFPLPVVQD